MADVKPEDYEAVVELEEKFHDEIFKWMVERNASNPEKGIEMCDLSDDYVIFSQVAARYLKPTKLTVVSRGDHQPLTYKKVNEKPEYTIDESKKIDVSHENYEATVNPENMGKYDLILCKEMLYEVKDLPRFFNALKSCLNEGNSKIFILARPKNPPVPLPDPALATWRKMTPSREQILEAAHEADMMSDFYSASVPIRIEKEKWWKVLRSRSFAAIRNCDKCPDREIREFIHSRPTHTLQFEERIIILVLWIPTEEDRKKKEEDKRKADEYAQTLN